MVGKWVAWLWEMEMGTRGGRAGRGGGRGCRQLGRHCCGYGGGRVEKLYFEGFGTWFLGVWGWV